MATAAPAAPTVNAYLFASGTASAEAKKSAGEIQATGHDVPSKIPATVWIPVGTSQTRPSARPDKLLFGALDDPEFRLRQAIPLDVCVEESSVVLTWTEVEEFGYGSTMGVALDDFAQTVRELHRRLLAEDTQLGPDLQKVKDVLATYIEPRKR
jgi:hypothetical protein